jgi:hypothetical protein
MSYSIILLAETLLEWGCMRGLTSGRIVEHGFAGTFETSTDRLLVVDCCNSCNLQQSFILCRRIDWNHNRSRNCLYAAALEAIALPLVYRTHIGGLRGSRIRTSQMSDRPQWESNAGLLGLFRNSAYS